MPLYDNSTFAAPDMNQGDNSQSLLNNYLQYHQQEAEKHQQFQKDLLNLQSNLRMKELDHSLTGPFPYDGQQPKQNVLYDTYRDRTLEQGAEKLAFTKKMGEDKNRITEENNDEKNKIAQQNADTKTTLANDPNYAQMRTAGGQVYYIDKKSGKLVDTGVQSGTQTDAQKAQNTVNLENTKEGNREKLENTKQGNRATNIATRGSQAISNIKEQGNQTRQTRAIASPNSASNLPSQKLVESKLRAAEFISKNSELGKFVHIDPNTGLVTVAPTSTGYFGYGGGGPTPEQRQQIMDAIYPNRQSVSDKPVADTPNPTPTAAPTGQVKVTDGTRNYLWDTSKGPIPNGFKAVGGGQ